MYYFYYSTWFIVLVCLIVVFSATMIIARICKSRRARKDHTVVVRQPVYQTTAQPIVISAPSPVYYQSNAQPGNYQSAQAVNMMTPSAPPSDPIYRN